MTREGNSYLPVEQGPTAAAQGVIRGNQNNQLRLPDAPQLGGGQGTSGGRITGNFFSFDPAQQTQSATIAS